VSNSARRRSLAQAQERAGAERIAGRLDSAEIDLLERLLSPLRDKGAGRGRPAPADPAGVELQAEPEPPNDLDRRGNHLAAYPVTLNDDHPGLARD
jgi:hypothetical protein